MNDWVQININDFVDNNSPICYGVLKPGKFDSRGVPLVRIVDLKSGKVQSKGLFQITHKLDREFIRSKIQENDVLLSIQGTIGRVAVVPKELEGANISRTIARIRLSGNLIPYYLKYFLESEFGQRLLADNVSGTTRDSLNISKIRQLSIQAPKDTKKQITIAKVLSTVDQAIDHTEKIIAKYERIKTGLMQDLLTKGIDEQGNIRSEETHEFKDSPLGRIPVEWEVRKISEFGSVITGSTPSTKDDKNYGEAYQFVAPVDIGTNQFINKTEKMLSHKGFSLSRPIPPKSISVVCIGSTIGKVGMTTKLCTTNQQVNTLIPHNNRFSEIIYFLFKLNLDLQLNREVGLQAVPIVNKTKFSQILIPFPKSNVEIQSMTEKLNNIQKLIKKNIDALYKQKRIKTALMQDLLTNKVSVEPLMQKEAAII